MFSIFLAKQKEKFSFQAKGIRGGGGGGGGVIVLHQRLYFTTSNFLLSLLTILDRHLMEGLVPKSRLNKNAVCIHIVNTNL